MGYPTRARRLAVEEDARLFLRGDRLEVLSGIVHVFIKSNSGRSISWHELSPGDTAQLRRGVSLAATLALEENLMSK